MTNFENQKDEILKILAVNGDWCIWDDGTMHSCCESGSCNKCKFITYKDRGCRIEKRFWLDQECEQQPSDESDDRWIPVTEKLPESVSNKLITIKHDLGNRTEIFTIDIAYYTYGNGTIHTIVQKFREELLRGNLYRIYIRRKDDDELRIN